MKAGILLLNINQRRDIYVKLLDKTYHEHTNLTAKYVNVWGIKATLFCY
jgi:hypothetical protein